MKKKQSSKCVRFFLSKVLQISRTTFFRATQSMQTNPQALECRGLYPTRKTDARSIQFVGTFIRQFPTFESHRDYKYLHPQLNVSKLHDLYVEECGQKDFVPTSLPIFRRVFMRDFELCFIKRTRKCKMCARIDNQANSLVLRKMTKKALKKQKKIHISEVRAVKKNVFKLC